MTLSSASRYQEIIQSLFSMLPMYQRVGEAAYKANLDNTRMLDRFYDHPHKAFRTVHVAGTNGKGSVSHMLAAVLQSAGYKTGLYTSPHYLDFRERIKVNGQCINKDFVVDFYHKSKSILKSVQPSFFELTVLMAFDYFRYRQVDIAVIEVGMGGRLDSTNVITPEVSIITNIGHDHQKFLGNTLPAIAIEKAGIIKQGIPVVIGETQSEISGLFIDIAAQRKSEIVFADQQYHVVYSLPQEDFHQQIRLLHNSADLNISCDLLGGYQVKNVITSLTAIEVLRKRIGMSDQAVIAGFADVRKVTGMMGRFELIGTNPPFYCDAAHNEEGFREMINHIKLIPYRRLHLMLGFVRDKSIDTMLKMIPMDTMCYYTQADIPRALPASEIADKARKTGLYGNVYDNSSHAMNDLRKKAMPDDLIMVTGSIFLVAEIIKAKKNIDSLCE